MKKVVLAFSGGLDTSYCAIYLSREMGLEVHAALADTGGFSDQELEKIEKRAWALGVKSYTRIDVSQEYYQTTVRYMIYGNVLKNGTYPISVSSERIAQAIAVGQYANQIGAQYICHGSTGAGNDQVRFDMIFRSVCPEVEIIALVREQRLSRSEEIAYLRERGVEFDFAKAEYSINQGIWGTSIGGRETLTSDQTLPEQAYTCPMTATAESERVTLGFTKGQLTTINDKEYHDPIEAIKTLQAIASPWAVGRDMHIGDTIIGIKGRVGFEAAAPMVIIKAHHTLEKHVLTKWQLYWKDQISTFYGNHLHEGHYHDPVMRDIEAMLEKSQRMVTGQVVVELRPYRFIVIGIKSSHDLMNNDFGAYGETMSHWTGEDVEGFGKIFGNQTSIYLKVNKGQE